MHQAKKVLFKQGFQADLKQLDIAFIPNAPKVICRIFIGQAQKFGISMKKGFIGRP